MTGPFERLVARLARLLGATRDELPALLWSFGYFFALLSAYGLLRPLREEMGVRHGVDLTLRQYGLGIHRASC